jgi:YVTN family beta-propeller protein
VANHTSKDVSVIDAATFKPVGQPIPVGGTPAALAITPDGRTVFVGLSEGGIAVIDTSKKQKVCQMATPPPLSNWALGDLAVADKGRKLYVTIGSHLAAATLDPYATCPAAVFSDIPLQYPYPNNMAIANAGNTERLFLTVQGGSAGHDPVLVFDVQRGHQPPRLISQWPTSKNPIANVGAELWSSPDGRQVWVFASDACSHYGGNSGNNGCAGLGPDEVMAGRGFVNIIDANKEELVDYLSFRATDPEFPDVPIGSLDAAAFSPSGQEIAVLTTRGVLFFNTSTHFQTGAVFPPKNIPSGERAHYYSSGAQVVYSGDGTRLFVTRADANSVHGIQLINPPAPSATITYSKRAAWALAGQLACWIALILLYPRSDMVQAVFFWNPTVRKFFGLWYVGFLLTWNPFLRGILLSPFKERLRADARLDQYDPDTYFGESRIGSGPGKSPTLLRDAIPEIDGQIVLEGDSGLGKTTFVRQLLARSNRIIVYLLASDCKEDVLNAIQSKLEGAARDPDFLRTLIYARGMDVCIDGLNEVDADTRARVAAFATQYPRAHLLLVTQPIDWEKPSEAQIYTLLALEEEQLAAFLTTRKPELAPTISEAVYKERCSTYLATALNSEQPQELLDAARQALSNPMDLTTVAEMLARGEQPDLSRLQQQQYEAMAASYRRTSGQPFQLDAFAQMAYKMRFEKKRIIPTSGFSGELAALKKHKMVYTREQTDDSHKTFTTYYFRHDRIWDFFILQLFLTDDTLPEQHLDDAKFRNVYFQLATRMRLEDAKMLKDYLVLHAARTKDHSVSDRFVELLYSRERVLMRSEG